MDKPALVFDLGGVFVELTGLATMKQWTKGRLSVDQLWTIWFESDYVKQFESGFMDPKTFARGIIHEFGLPVNADEFLVHFSGWSNQLFPGSRHLLKSLKDRYTLASLSNTNSIHWTFLCENLCIDKYFHINFPSHLIGKVKPEIDTFHYVIEQLSIPPEQIYFFDDTVFNVENAKKAGLKAFQVVGLNQLKETLNRLELV